MERTRTSDFVSPPNSQQTRCFLYFIQNTGKTGRRRSMHLRAFRGEGTDAEGASAGWARRPIVWRLAFQGMVSAFSDNRCAPLPDFRDTSRDLVVDRRARSHTEHTILAWHPPMSPASLLPYDTMAWHPPMSSASLLPYDTMSWHSSHGVLSSPPHHIIFAAASPVLVSPYLCISCPPNRFSFVLCQTSRAIGLSW